ncbi:hydroxyethylthiazole kinase [Arboricoccus pini]|uniref:Hydroxyethylthiazole kinase n=1 Tax=Arboricoccus pini TaxID=1963835 RepID=A0A212PZ60_9PROT|nr:hydroxyethylthiazole kinase [Arboricoccus pini]SNB52346.1 hydroxyethylthiazole kinase [Arboricoccus pini]
MSCPDPAADYVWNDALSDFSPVSLPSNVSRTSLVAATAKSLDKLRDARPRVHALTNFVAMNVSANVMLASGAVPSMTFRAESMPDFVASTASLLVNLGQLEPEREAAIKRAVPLALELNRPWVLDPVKVERSGMRQDLAAGLLRLHPAVLRANRDEVLALLGTTGSAEPDLEGATDTARLLAQSSNIVVAATGAVDIITDGKRTIRLANGSLLMDRVTAMGCASSALLACFLAVEPDPLLAAAQALFLFGVAGEVAAERAAGPGTFEPHLIDAIFAMDAATLDARGKLL